MFASRESTNCSQFVSHRRDDSPLEINTLAGQWPKGLLYWFPLIGLLSAHLHRIWIGELQFVLVALNWPHVVWSFNLQPLISGIAIGAPGLEGSTFTGTKGSVSSHSPEPLALGLALKRIGLLEMDLPQTVVRILQGAWAPSRQHTYTIGVMLQAKSSVDLRQSCFTYRSSWTEGRLYWPLKEWRLPLKQPVWVGACVLRTVVSSLHIF